MGKFTLIHTDQSVPLDGKYMPLLQFLSQGMKDRDATTIVYALKPFIENIKDNDKLVALIEELR